MDGNPLLGAPVTILQAPAQEVKSYGNVGRTVMNQTPKRAQGIKTVTAMAPKQSPKNLHFLNSYTQQEVAFLIILILFLFRQILVHISS